PRLWAFLQPPFSSYCGIDAVRYDGSPSSGEFRQADFDRSDWSVDSNAADLVVSLETIEHVENPWAFMRGLARIVKPGAWLAPTTPNQLSWLSLATAPAKAKSVQAMRTISVLTGPAELIG